MDIFDQRKKQEKIKVPAGTILILQGSIMNSLMVLHSGMAELLATDNDITGRSPEHIIEASHRVGLVKGVSVCGILGLYDGLPLSNSILTVSECVVTNTPVENHMIVPTLQKQMYLNNQVLLAMVQRIESAIFLFNNYKYLWHKLASIQDSIALGIDMPVVSQGEDSLNRYEVSLEEYASFLRLQAERAQSEMPEAWDSNVFLGRLQNELNLYSDYDSLHIEGLFDHSQYVFFKRLLRKPEKLVVGIFYKDEPTNFYVFRFLSDSLKEMLTHNTKLVTNILALQEILYADNAWVNQVIAKNLGTNRKYLAYLHYLWKFSWRCHRDSIKLLRIDLTKKYPVYKQLLQYKTIANVDEMDSEGQTRNLFTSGDTNKLAKYKNLFLQILDFSEVSQGFKDEINDLLNQIKGLSDMFALDKPAVELRTRFATLYWELYEICLLKIINTDLKSFIPGIMLHFGLLDETMVTVKELEIIDDAYAKLLYVDQPIPAMTLPYFLEKIYTGEINPSISEMGESFRELLRRQERMTKKERAASSYIFNDNADERVRYEIRNITSEIGKMLFGSKRKALPILCSQAILGSMDRVMLDPEKTVEMAEKYHQRDYSLFFRDIVCRHSLGTDIVKNEILPNFVVYPVVGSRMMMWQELDGTRKDTPGRFFLPLYFNEKAEEGIGTVLAQFRWELARTVAGANWMDPVEGGLAGAYYDYIAFYKKNPNLSPEHKQKVAEFIKKTRSDRDRFTADYLTWLLFEYEGKLRFNQVARDIMYRFVPFNRDMREEMAKKPLYTDLENKRKNRNRKDVLRLESRMKKFEKSAVPLPEEIQKYLEFLNS